MQTKTTIRFLILFINCLIVNSAYATFSVINSESIKQIAVYAIILFTIIGIGAYTSFFNKYVEKSFLEPEVYCKHRNFWIATSVLVPFFAWILITEKPCQSISHCLDKNFVFLSIIWMSYLLTTTLGPAIYQNHSNNGVTEVILFFNNAILITLLAFYLTDIEITKNHLVLTTAAIFIFFALVIWLSSFQLLKSITKEILFVFAIGLDLILPLFIVIAFAFLLSN